MIGLYILNVRVTEFIYLIEEHDRMTGKEEILMRLTETQTSLYEFLMEMSNAAKDNSAIMIICKDIDELNLTEQQLKNIISYFLLDTAVTNESDESILQNVNCN